MLKEIIGPVTILSLLALLVGCEASDLKSKRDAVPQWSPTEERLDLPEQTLAPVDAAGVSKTALHLDLKPGSLVKMAVISYDYNLAAKSFKISRPTLTTEGCTESVSYLQKKDDEGKISNGDNFYWHSFTESDPKKASATDWSESETSDYHSIDVAFGETVTVESTMKKGGIDFLFYIPANCTKLNLQFEVRTKI